MHMSFPNHWHAKPLFYGYGFHYNWQTFNVDRACYCLLILLYIKLTFIFSGERMIILHAGYNEGFVPNAQKIILLSYIKKIKHQNQYMQ